MGKTAKHLIDPKTNLNPQQKEFCEIYVKEDHFGNGTYAYKQAYKTPGKEITTNHAKANACKLLTNTYILDYINTMLDFEGFNEAFVDVQLLSVIKQSADLGAKIAAIREFNKLKARITDKMDITTKGKALNKEYDLSKLSDEELRLLAKIESSGRTGAEEHP